MKKPRGVRRRCGISCGRLLFMMVLAVLLGIGSSGIAMAASGGGHGEPAEAGHGGEHGAVADSGHGAAAEHEAQGGHGDAHGTKGWVATDTYRVMNFLVLAVGLFLLLKKPVAQALNARIVGIKEQLEELETKKTQAEGELAAYAEKISALEEEAESIIAEYVKQGNAAKERILETAEATAGKLEEQARRNIEREFQNAKSKLQDEILERALARAEAMLKAGISADDQSRLVDEYLEKVVA